MKCLLLSFVILCASAVNAQQAIDVAVRGISDNKREGAQKDRLEAIMDAKRQACEKAGISIESTTTVENFQAVYDYVESQAEAVLLPGFQIIDNGYGEDGTYSVVLVGKVKSITAGEHGSASFILIIWLQKEYGVNTAAYKLLDDLYVWLEQTSGTITVNGEPLDKFEKQLAGVSKAPKDNRRSYYAYTYHFPAGEFLYTQRTKNTDGSVSSYDYKQKLRPGLKYVMEVAHLNAIYFNRPKEFEGSAVKGTYPQAFKIINKGK